MKKSDSKSEKDALQEELKRLREENKSLSEENKQLKASKAKLNASKKRLKDSKNKLKADLKDANAELKKKDVQRITLTKEQEALISILFPDIDILSWSYSCVSLSMSVPTAAWGPWSRYWISFESH